MIIKLRALLFFSSFFYHLFIVNAVLKNEQKKCSQHIYRECTHQTEFTPKQIQTAQLYLQKRFSVTNPIKPACIISQDKPPCIRKDIKCLTKREIRRLTKAWVKLYQNGVIANFTKLHFDYWGATHKFNEGVQAHICFINKLEKELQKIDPCVCMPYWNFPQEFARPEESKIWEIFGHTGNESNDYCVPDGPFSTVNCTFPDNHCLRRQWRDNYSLNPWKSPEYFTMASQLTRDRELFLTISTFFEQQETDETIQSMDNYLKYTDIITNKNLTNFGIMTAMNALCAHFDTHLSIGGWNGDMSVPNAPNDPIFHVFHIYYEVMGLLWQLSNFDDYYLVPKSYNTGMKYDNISKTYRFADIDSDRLAYYHDISVKESFEFGYGDLCHLYDVIIEPINEIVDKNLRFELRYPKVNISECVPDVAYIPLPPELPATLPKRLLRPCNAGPMPTAAQRLKNALNSTLFEKYFPKFAHNNWTHFDHILFDVSNCCNPVNYRCRTMPIALPLNATLEGQRQYDGFTRKVADHDITLIANVGRNFYEKFMNQLSDSGYCSPYV